MALELKLHSPAGEPCAVFTWPLEKPETKKDGVFVGGDEIVKTIQLVCEDYPQLYQQNLCLDNCDIHSFQKMKELCDKYNKIIDTLIRLNRGTEAFSARFQQRASQKLFKHILQQVYTRAVTNPEKLRTYEPFSPSVYGETSVDLIDNIIKIIDLRKDDTFIDLGSGVGNVVLQIAALTDCKHVYGIEHEEIPAKYAEAMESEFRFWMRWYGKRFSDFQLERGDFLLHEKINDRIKEADVIFVNNFVFGANVDHELKLKFMNMKDGAKIVSSKEFCSIDFRLNDRTKNDIGAVMQVSKPDELYGKVSWSDKSVHYFLHTIDHKKLAKYYEDKKRPQSTKVSKPRLNTNGEDENSLSSTSNNSPTSSCSSKSSPKIVKLKSTNATKSLKHDENKPPISKKRKIQVPLTSVTTSLRKTSTVTRNRRKPDKFCSEDEDIEDDDFDLSMDDDLDDNEHLSTKRRKSSTHYRNTLGELHKAAETMINPTNNNNTHHSSTSTTVSNENRYNYREMTKLSNDNLELKHFRDLCVLEHEDQRFSNFVNVYLHEYRKRLINYFNYMKTEQYHQYVKQQLDDEIDLNKSLKGKIVHLENSIETLLNESIELLKLRTKELGFENLQKPDELITYANNISNTHKELCCKVASLNKEINELDTENEEMATFLNGLTPNSGINEQNLNNEVQEQQQHVTEQNSPVLNKIHSLNSKETGNNNGLQTDNTYSSLLASMSVQTQLERDRHNNNNNNNNANTNQILVERITPNMLNATEPTLTVKSTKETICAENTLPSIEKKRNDICYSPISPTNEEKDLTVTMEFLTNKPQNIAQRKEETYQNNSKKEPSNIVSPLKLVKINERPKNGRRSPLRSAQIQTLSANINNLLSTKKIEPVQVHSVVTRPHVYDNKYQQEHQTLNRHQLNLADKVSLHPIDVKQVYQQLTITQPILSNNIKMEQLNIATTSSPKKKRDYFGKSSGSTCSSVSSSSNDIDPVCSTSLTTSDMSRNYQSLKTVTIAKNRNHQHSLKNNVLKTLASEKDFTRPSSTPSSSLAAVTPYRPKSIPSI
ncbi:unnamed protein product [Didymodactylos carnosus]|uniref:Histone-lysine N-methyltransferase, H3 lysine-79 specific n=1 Tax=Didymodactylos carnosus TaxID=1234261 RepID=A0A813QWL8_9BILA|nr:unnamed protein product [Didymodactylos carnosus]CAF0801477.1 unnamed protein product [Didymodactylos carnosus]CAF3555406.1 unnamed protein product [Didymodactylos carnosus]CAF3584837.1 unnamed protein product [Didymodactylos carnosus]